MERQHRQTAGRQPAKAGKSPWYRHWAFRNLLLALLIVLLFLAGVTLLLNLITRHNRELTVPDFTNQSVAQARETAGRHHLIVEVTDSVYVKRMARGFVTRQHPAAGSRVKKNRRILLTINSVLPRQATMPDLTGLSLRQARTELQAKGLGIGTLIYVPDMATNNVLAQQLRGVAIAPGTPVESETRIDLILGRNEFDCTTFVPDLTGYRFQAACDRLFDNSLNIGQLRFDETVLTYTDSLNARVFRMTPAPSDSVRLPMGTRVALHLTLDPEKIVREEKTDE